MKKRPWRSGSVWLGLALVTLSALGFGQRVGASTEKEKPLEWQEILSKLTFTSRINHSVEDLNAQLVAAVQKRGVNFTVSDKDRAAIRKAGGSDELIKAIDAAPKPSVEPKALLSGADQKRFDDENALYEIVLKNYRTASPTDLQKAIDAAREFLRRFADDSNTKTIVDWLRPKIPVWESKIQRYD